MMFVYTRSHRSAFHQKVMLIRWENVRTKRRAIFNALVDCIAFHHKITNIERNKNKTNKQYTIEQLLEDFWIPSNCSILLICFNLFKKKMHRCKLHYRFGVPELIMYYYIQNNFNFQGPEFSCHESNFQLRQSIQFASYQINVSQNIALVLLYRN